LCPTELRETYEDGKEETLIRILLRHLPAEYDVAVKTVKDLARLRKYGESGKLEAILIARTILGPTTLLITFPIMLSFVLS
jgi:hypothetical protein